MDCLNQLRFESEDSQILARCLRWEMFISSVTVTLFQTSKLHEWREIKWRRRRQSCHGTNFCCRGSGTKPMILLRSDPKWSDSTNSVINGNVQDREQSPCRLWLSPLRRGLDEWVRRSCRVYQPFCTIVHNYLLHSDFLICPPSKHSRLINSTNLRKRRIT